MMRVLSWLVLWALHCSANFVVASVAAPLSVTADRADAIYCRGETVTFVVQIPPGSLVKPDAELLWTISKDGVPPVQSGKARLAQGGTKVTGSLKEPGHLLCRVTAMVEGEAVSALAGAAIDPLLIEPSLPAPDDFDAFWNEQRRKLAEIPLTPRLTPVAAPVANAQCFDVQMDCVGGTPVSGYLAKPIGAKQGTLPAMLFLHGAGVTSASLGTVATWCTNRVLAMDINAHGIANGKPSDFYRELEQGRLKNYRYAGRESRESCYFLGMFLRAIRAVDFLAAQAEWDRKHVVVYGSSQGGFQCLAVAGLDPRVTFIAAGVPAGCDHTGAAVGRVSGWPKLVPQTPGGKSDEQVMQVSKYFDAVNFAARTTAKGAFVTVGFIDTTCPPTTVYAAYNALPMVKKQIYNDIPTAHANSPEATRARNKAVLDYFKIIKSGIP